MRINTCLAFFNGSLLIQMHSDYLNDDLICELFVDEAHPQPSEQQPKREREEVSLNLTVTSRDSKSNAHQTGNNYNQYMDSNHAITLALSEIDKFNSWASNMSTLNSKQNMGQDDPLEQLEDLQQKIQSLNPMLLTMPDLGYLRRKIINQPNLLSQCKCSSVNQKYQSNKSKTQTHCQECVQKDELIEIIKEEHEIKIEQCRQYGIKISQLEQLNQIQLKEQLRKTMTYEVENNLLKQQNQDLKNQLSQLRGQIEKQKLQKSAILQKSNSLLRTKDLLEKRLQTANQKSFSNAKNSTNPTNLNDSINRVESMICFGQSEPNIDQILKFYNQEYDFFRDKIKKLISQEEKKLNKKLREETRKKFIAQLPEKRIYDNYYNLIKYLKDLKENKQKFSDSFCSMKSKKFQSLDTTTVNSQQFQQLRKAITILERDNVCLETQKKNLMETNDDLVEQIQHLTQKVRELLIKIQEKEEKIKENEGIQKSYKSELQKYQIQYKSIYHKYRLQIKERKKLSFEIQDIKGSIRVYCRVRPRLGAELKQKSIVNCMNSRKLIKDGKEYQFDQIFNERSTQQQIFAQTKSLVEYAYEGKKLCVFAYGQTGSGKTFTIHGNNQNPGLAHNIIGQLFNLVERDRQIYKTSVLMNIVEIYKENLKDLLQISDKVQIKQDAQKGIYLEGCWPVRVKNLQQMMDMYQRGMSKRTKSQTEMNNESSRSHCIIIISIEQVSLKSKNEDRSSKITLIDLAGAQKLTSSNPLVAKETQFINKSLSSLVDVFAALKEKKEHIPYRNSKLTHLLKDCLTNKCNILTFINISPNEGNSNETTNSLNFGLKTKSIQRYQLSEPMQSKSRPKQNKENQKHRRSITTISHA